MTSINFNTGTVSTTTTSVNSQPANTQENKNTEVAPAQVETTNVSEKDTFAYMAGTAAYNMANVKLSPQAMVNKYNSPEAIARIEAMMGDFVEGAVSGLAKFEEEFGDASFWAGLSEADRLALGAELYASEAL